MKRLIFWKKYYILVLLFGATNLQAGPPFFTDDPQPVDYLHWEFYLASEQQFGRNEVDATLPHIEVNYGVIPDVQLHLVAPMGFKHTQEGNMYNYSNTEFGIKYRFISETNDRPQIGAFPLIEIPTENNGNRPGDNKLQALFPIWIQKSWGKLTSYGGAGFWYNPGDGKKNWIFTGWEIQYDFSEVLTIGSEMYFYTADQQNSGSSVGFNIGGYINLDSNSHILFSLGHNINGETATTGYIGFLFTI